MKKIVIILIAVIGFGFSVNAQSVIPFRSLQTSLCCNKVQISLFPKGYIPAKSSDKYKYEKENVVEILLSTTDTTVVLQSGTWKYVKRDNVIELSVKSVRGMSTSDSVVFIKKGDEAKYSLTSLRTNTDERLVFGIFEYDSEDTPVIIAFMDISYTSDSIPELRFIDCMKDNHD